MQQPPRPCDDIDINMYKSDMKEAHTELKSITDRLVVGLLGNKWCAAKRVDVRKKKKVKRCSKCLRPYSTKRGN